jgi:AcrR family transcriptional regulator
VTRTHGWSGRPPADDDEATRRIIDAARRCIERQGSNVSLSDVARELNVTRPTVYRYFAGTDELLRATAIDAAGAFLDRVASHLARRPGPPAEIVVEGAAYTLEQLRKDPYLGVILGGGRAGVFTDGFTGPAAMELGRAFIERFPVDWDAAGFDAALLDGLVEHMLRIMQSFVIDPGSPPRRGNALRSYLRLWLAPVVTVRHQLAATAVDADGVG